jgi:hypothetical protein
MICESLSLIEFQISSIKISDRIVDFHEVQNLLIDADQFAWAGSSVEFARDQIEQLQDFCDWRDSLFSSSSESKISKENEENILNFFQSNGFKNLKELALSFVNRMLDYYSSHAMSQKLEQLEKVLENAVYYYNGMSTGSDKKIIGSKIKQFQNIVEKGQYFRNKARGFRKQKTFRQEDFIKFWESAQNECPVSLEEFESMLDAPLKSLILK